MQSRLYQHRATSRLATTRLRAPRPTRLAAQVCAAKAPPSVVVTGASSGIGKAIAAMLAANGWRVFAGVRSDAAAADLRALSELIEPITIDVADTGSVEAATARVREAVGRDGLQGLVNNAGFGIFVPVECFTDDAWESVMNVNVTGVVRCTRAMLPLLRAGERRGRVVNMSSIAGSTSYPLFGVYSASKHALEGLSDALRFELRDQGIPVSIVKPGPVVTDIWRRGREGSAKQAVSDEGLQLYGHLIEKTTRLTEESEADGVPADDVAKVVLHALTSRSPRSRYLVGKSAPALHLLRRLLPDSIWNAMIDSYYRRPSSPLEKPLSRAL